LREGKLTLPVIHALEKTSPENRDWIKKIISGKNFTTGEFDRLIHLMNDTGSIRYCRDAAGAHIQKAREIIGTFPPSPTAETLTMIADYTLNRDA
jgi:octaprenyl-diphosphate synthase